ncbi:MAG: sulfotransferase family 2 domain-containing protein [Flavobacteriaceae bacterium]
MRILYGKLKFRLRRFLDHFTLSLQRVSNALMGRKPVHFLHIGKTGGTALKYAIKGHSKSKDYFIKGHLHQFHLDNVPKGEKFFFCIRDPKDRFTSAFYARMREDKPRFYLPWNQGEAQAFSIFKTPNELAEALSSSDDKLRSSAKDAMSTIGHIRESYWKWFRNETYFMERMPDLVHVCHLETIKDDLEVLKEKLSLSENLQLPGKGINSHSSPETLDKTLSPLALANLRSWYARDYEFLKLLENKNLIKRKAA